MTLPSSRFVVDFDQYTSEGRPLVGGKNRRWESSLSPAFPVPPGFAVVTDAFGPLGDGALRLDRAQLTLRAAEGSARVISSPDQIDEVEGGDVLVAPLTAPSWGLMFSKIVATVSDVGGMMSHAAIVCREHGPPAASSAAVATARIKTGQRVRADGGAGTVTIVE